LPFFRKAISLCLFSNTLHKLPEAIERRSSPSGENKQH
jgi:hypothetical protein